MPENLRPKMGTENQKCSEKDIWTKITIEKGLQQKKRGQCNPSENNVRKCAIPSSETARNRSHRASYDPQLPPTLTGNELVLDGGREAADVGDIDAETPVTRFE